MARPALKLVEKDPFFVEEGEFWNSDDSEFHTLHFSISYPDSFRPQLPSYFIRKYSARGDIVLDPFSGRGTTALEANLLGRVAYAADINPLSCSITSSKLAPADLVEVALFIQGVNYKRPVSMDGYSEFFEPFYDPETYRELLNLRAYIKENRSQVSGFTQLVALSLLHGHTAGFFSAYSLPQISVSPTYQRELNDRRGKLPDYRAVAPRLLRKAGAVMRDGDLSLLNSMADRNRVFLSDARDLRDISTGLIDLVVTSPPKPFSKNFIEEMWLKLWFFGLSSAETEQLRRDIVQWESIEAWREFMNEFLFEMARVVRSGGRAVLDLSVASNGEDLYYLDQEVIDIVSCLSSYWEVDGLIVNVPPAARVAGALKRRSSTGKINRELVLRRK